MLINTELSLTPLENRTLLNSEFSKVGFSNGVTIVVDEANANNECNSSESVENHHITPKADGGTDDTIPQRAMRSTTPSTAEAVICGYTGSMATSEGGHRLGMNITKRLTQKDIANINEMQVEQDKGN